MSERPDNAKTSEPDDKNTPGVHIEHHPSWTDGFPQTFHGWGPQTPDLESDTEAHVHFDTPGGDLRWRGDNDREEHIVWRLDSRIH